MGAWELLLVGVVLLIGLCGVMVPGVPGSWLVWAGVAWWAVQDTRTVAWGVLVGATVVLLVAQAVRWQLPPRRLRQNGTTRRMALCAGAGSLLGFFLVPVLGALLGFVGGVYLAERVRLGSHGEAAASTRNALRVGGWSVLVEWFACLLVIGAWWGVLVWG
ncbi:DUF456 domain-containing protein [Streptomyces sp. NPDC058171]